MHSIGPIEDFAEEGIYPILIYGHDLLLVNSDGHYYLIENKCGHFGLPLADGEVIKDEIFCPQHGISFDLISGQVKNRPWENCAPINVYKLNIEDRHIFIDDSSLIQ